jgi:tetratricopeptide (TPR) repeat protein
MFPRMPLFLQTFCAMLLLAVCFTQAPPSKPPSDPVQRAVQLSRAHRYKEAAAALHGVTPPVDGPRRISFFRLRASIESGLGQSSAAALDMEAAAKLAPENLDLQVAARLAHLAAQLDSHVSPAQSLAVLRNFRLPGDKELQLRLQMAETLSRANLFAEAAKDFAAASSLAPRRADIFFNLALAHFRDGDLDAALASAERAKSVQDSASLESLLGDIQERRGDSLAAVHSYQAAVTLEPSVEQHHLVLARELLTHQTFDAAIVVLEQSAQIFPQSARVKILLGLTYYVVDRSTDSIRSLLEATQLDPNDDLTFRYLGEITLEDTATPNPVAVSRVCAFADSHPSSGTANALCGGILLRVAEDNGDASHRPEILRRLQRAARLAPKDALARCQSGRAFEWSGQWVAARVQLENCIQLDPESPEAHYHLARVYRRLGLTALANQQTALQQQAAQGQSEESARRNNTVTKFLVLIDH